MHQILRLAIIALAARHRIPAALAAWLADGDDVRATVAFRAACVYHNIVTAAQRTPSHSRRIAPVISHLAARRYLSQTIENGNKNIFRNIVREQSSVDTFSHRPS